MSKLGSQNTDRDAQIVSAYLRKGGTLQSVGEAFGISGERVRQILVKAGQFYRHHVDKEQFRADYDLYLQRKITRDELARRHDIQPGSVWEIAKHYGLTRKRVPLTDRRCCICKVIKTKTAEHFVRNTQNTDGLSYVCKACSRAKTNELYHTSESFRERQKQWKRDNPEKVEAAYRRHYLKMKAKAQGVTP